MTNKKRKYLVFTVDEDSYCAPLQAIKEIIAITSVAPLPNVPPYVLGLFNLRGQIISVIDMRAKLGLPPSPVDPMKNSIVISQVESLTIGFLVDEVTAVEGFDQSEIELSADIGDVKNKEYISGIAKKSKDTDLKLILDLPQILSRELLNSINHAQSAA